MGNKYQVPISKAKRSIEVDESDLSDEMFKLVVAEGLKVLLNAKMSTIKTTGKEGEELANLQAEAYAKAETNLSDLKAGKVSKGRATSKITKDGKKIAGPVLVEARRRAKEIVRNELRAANVRISLVAASDITKAANAFLETDAGQQIIVDAEAAIAARAGVKSGLNILDMVKESPILVKRAETEKAERKSVSSAKQAGKPKVRASGKVPPAKPKAPETQPTA